MNAFYGNMHTLATVRSFTPAARPPFHASAEGDLVCFQDFKAEMAAAEEEQRAEMLRAEAAEAALAVARRELDQVYICSRMRATFCPSWRRQ